MTQDEIVRLSALAGAVLFIAGPAMLKYARDAVSYVATIRVPSSPFVSAEADESLVVELLQRVKASKNRAAESLCKQLLLAILNPEGEQA